MAIFVGLPNLRVPEHIHFCFAAETCVFLDLARNQYFALDSESSNWFREALTTDKPRDPGGPAFANELLSSGLLEVREGSAPISVHSSIPKAMRTLVDPDAECIPRAKPSSIFLFIVALTKALVLSRFRCLHQLVRRVDRRRTARAQGCRLTSEQLLELVVAFQYLCPFFYSRRDHCFFDSIVFVEYLAMHDVFPEWIFGVATQPFSAHCWLQLGNVVLNDRLARTRVYTPILAA